MDKKDDLYAQKREMLKQARTVRNKILGTDEVDGTTMQRFYGEATKTKRALKIEFFGSKSKASATKGEETSIEKTVREWLEEANINFKEQKAVRYINVDFFLPEKNIIIQCHGTYWHCDPREYSVPKNNIQRKNIEKDIVANDIIKQQKYFLIDVWQKDLEERPTETRAKLLKIIENGPIATEEVWSVSSIDW